jgi:hypothetical protein
MELFLNIIGGVEKKSNAQEVSGHKAHDPKRIYPDSLFRFPPAGIRSCQIIAISSPVVAISSPTG